MVWKPPVMADRMELSVMELLGGTVVLQLMDSASEIFRYEWFKNKAREILNGRKNLIVYNVIKERSSFTPSNGTFRINRLSRTDGGVETSCDGRQDGAQCYGALGGTVVLQLMDSTSEIFKYTWFQNKSKRNTEWEKESDSPVSSVLLVFECLSQGDMRVSCSSEGGDSPQYSWTVDGHTLTDAELLSGNNEAKDIILKQGVSGQLVCSVRNNVSEVSKEEKISTCSE
ncbi:hypothetical protein L3Q82_005765 [Scortum barcoo]|uniref:Uncharacterized protein n=1 Tax=Scortum barcoo TaxID=214431 RepID=A0ACB8V6H5_9TELE|nr:hypothetical protein L3Q82_005765 [Scortum barcoo]